MFKTVSLAALFTVVASLASANPVEGVWKTKADDNGNSGYIQIKACGALFCGTLIKSFDKSGKEMKSENVGKRIIWDMKAYDDGLFDDGKVWSPDRNKTYDADMTLTGDKLAIRGCIIGICRSGGTWTRVK